MAAPPRLKQKFAAPKRSQLSPPAAADLLRACKCTGVLFSGGVLVRDPSHIDSLVQQGCYGKGIFSRSVPRHEQAGLLRPVTREARSRGGGEQAAAGGWVVGGSSTAADTWRSKLDDFEASRKKRLHLHAQWKQEEEEMKSEPQAVGVSESVLVEGSSSSSSSGEGSGLKGAAGMEENVRSKLGDLRRDTSSSSSLYEDFLRRMKQLSEQDPYNMSEHLMLSSAEAFYLAHELNALHVEDTTGKLLTTDDLWSHFHCHGSSNFAEQYVTYRYYRSKGWVPKSGLKFGVDYLLYKDGPQSYHSSYAVLVRPATGGEQHTASAGEGLTWREVMAHCRVNEAAGKDLIICEVVRPPLSEGKHGGVSCLNGYTVRETFVSRWVPERERNK